LINYVLLAKKLLHQGEDGDTTGVSGRLHNDDAMVLIWRIVKYIAEILILREKA